MDSRLPACDESTISQRSGIDRQCAAFKQLWASAEDAGCFDAPEQLVRGVGDQESDPSTKRTRAVLIAACADIDRTRSRRFIEGALNYRHQNTANTSVGYGSGVRVRSPCQKDPDSFGSLLLVHPSQEVYTGSSSSSCGKSNKVGWKFTTDPIKSAGLVGALFSLCITKQTALSQCLLRSGLEMRGSTLKTY